VIHPSKVASFLRKGCTFRIQRQLDDLQTMTDEYLTTLRARLNEYLAQSRLAIARLYDDSLQRKMRSAGGDK